MVKEYTQNRLFKMRKNKNEEMKLYTSENVFHSALGTHSVFTLFFVVVSEKRIENEIIIMNTQVEFSE